VASYVLTIPSLNAVVKANTSKYWMFRVGAMRARRDEQLKEVDPKSNGVLLGEVLEEARRTEELAKNFVDAWDKEAEIRDGWRIDEDVPLEAGQVMVYKPGLDSTQVEAYLRQHPRYDYVPRTKLGGRKVHDWSDDSGAVAAIGGDDEPQWWKIRSNSKYGPGFGPRRE